MQMEAGKLNKRAAFQLRDGSSQDAYGEQVVTWTDAGSRWIELRPVGPKNNDIAKGFADTVSHTVILRRWDVLRPKHRLTCEDRTFYIDGVVHSSDFRTTTLYVTEQLDA